MITMLIGLVLFLGAHVFTTRRAARAAVIARIGEGPYKGLYALVSTIGLLLTAYGFGEWRSEGPRVLYDPPTGLRHLTLLLMLFASIALVAADPTARSRPASAAGPARPGRRLRCAYRRTWEGARSPTSAPGSSIPCWSR